MKNLIHHNPSTDHLHITPSLHHQFHPSPSHPSLGAPPQCQAMPEDAPRMHVQRPELGPFGQHLRYEAALRWSMGTTKAIAMKI